METQPVLQQQTKQQTTSANGILNEPHIALKPEKKDKKPVWMTWLDSTRLQIEGTDGQVYVIEDKEYMYIASVYKTETLEGVEELETLARLLVEPKGLGIDELKKKRSSTIMRLLRGMNALMDPQDFL